MHATRIANHHPTKNITNKNMTNPGFRDFIPIQFLKICAKKL
jgi:hypothetical protein